MSHRLAVTGYLFGLAIAVLLVALWLSTPAPAADYELWQPRASELVQLRAENHRLRRTNAKLGRRVRALHRALRFDYEVTNAVRAASIVYRVPRSTLWQKMWCESKGWPFAKNKRAIGNERASGLFQFLPSTFRSTPFRSLSLWDPYVNALAAGWMMGPARRIGEWAC